MGIDQSQYINEFSFLNKLGRTLWAITYLLFFRFTHRIASPWRNLLLKSFGAKIGAGCFVSPSVKIWAPWNLTMGDYSALGPDVDCYTQDKIIIGNNVTVSQYVHLCTGSHDITHPRMKLIHLPIVIEDMAWVCAGAFVGPGVKIGQGAVVAARAVVTRDVQGWTVVGGNPARFIKRRSIDEESNV